MSSTNLLEAQEAVGRAELHRRNAFAQVNEDRRCAAERSLQHTSILVVEDDDTLRDAISSSLREAGYRVFETSSATTAREMFHSGMLVDLLITDIRMPGPSGITLAKELTLLQMRLPVMIVSGDSPDHAAWCDGMTRGWRFLKKPYSESALLKEIDELLNTRAAIIATPLHAITNAEPLDIKTDRHASILAAARPTPREAAAAERVPGRRVRFLSIGDDESLLTSRSLNFEARL